MEIVEVRIKKLVAELFGIPVGDVKREQVFMGDELAGDSLDVVELMMAFEEEFELEIPDEEAQKLTTVGSAIDFITARVPA